MLNKKVLILDTETISLGKPFVYDLGAIVGELQDEGRFYAKAAQKQFIITEIYDNAALFATGYYASKREQYSHLIKHNIAKRHTIQETMDELKKLISKHNITQVFAYNARFDERALEFTTKFFDIENPLAGIEWVDIQTIAGHYIHKSKDYIQFAVNNDMYTQKGYLNTNVETTYSFITNNPNYVEPHTALQDAEVETDILNFAISKGYNNSREYGAVFVPSPKTQKLTIIKNNKTYCFTYRQQTVKRDGTIILK